VNRDAKTQAALIALARTRRTQRALAHAYLHRGTPLPSLRTSLGFMTSTACVTEEAVAVGHHMTVLGVAPLEHVAYVVEELGVDEPPVVYRLYLRGVRQGHLRVATQGELPIRKFALQLVVEPVSGHGASGKTTVTAFLRPGAELAEVWALPGGLAIARVTYTGIPSGIGLTKDTVVLLTGIDYQDSHD